MAANLPAPLILTYDPSDAYDRATLEMSTRGHHTRCYLGSQARVAAALSDDPNWRTPRVKVMPERRVFHFNYGKVRYEQQMTRREWDWADSFDQFGLSKPLRKLTVKLDPNSPRTQPVHVVGAQNSTNSGRPAHRVTFRAGGGSSRPRPADPGQPRKPKNYGGPDGKGHTTTGCFTNEDGNSGRATRMRALNRQRLEYLARISVS